MYVYEYNIKGNLTKVYVDGVYTVSYNYDEEYNQIAQGTVLCATSEK